MTLKELAEWRGWIWIAVTLMMSLTAAGFGLYRDMQLYTDVRVADLQSDLCRQMSDIREDLRIIREDVKRLLQKP